MKRPAPDPASIILSPFIESNDLPNAILILSSESVVLFLESN